VVVAGTCTGRAGFTRPIDRLDRRLPATGPHPEGFCRFHAGATMPPAWRGREPRRNGSNAIREQCHEDPCLHSRLGSAGGLFRRGDTDRSLRLVLRRPQSDWLLGMGPKRLPGPCPAHCPSSVRDSHPARLLLPSQGLPVRRHELNRIGAARDAPVISRVSGNPANLALGPRLRAEQRGPDGIFSFQTELIAPRQWRGAMRFAYCALRARSCPLAGGSRCDSAVA
jgi:hypothetical protein